MKKLILTSIALSISIMSACTPTPAVNGVNPLTGSGNSGIVTKGQLNKYFDCIESNSGKIIQNDLGRMHIIREALLSYPDTESSDKNIAIKTAAQQLSSLSKNYAPTGCVL